MTERFLVEIEKNQKSACILDTETTKVYLLVKFTRLDKKQSRDNYIHNLYEVCELLNQLDKGSVNE